nr:uncharacterized protein LOC109748479 [Aegilops tauschii subsp. strangulata]
MYRIVFSCHSSEESEVFGPLLVMLQGSVGDADGRRKVCGLNGVVAAGARRSKAVARHLPLAPQTQGAGHLYDGFLRPLVARHEDDLDRGLLETWRRLPSVRCGSSRLPLVLHRSCRPRDQAGQVPHIDE